MGHYSGSHTTGDVRGLLTLAVCAGVAVPGAMLANAIVQDHVLLAVVVGGGILIAGAVAVGVAAWFVWRAVAAQRAHDRDREHEEDRVMLARAVAMLARQAPAPMIDVSALDAGDDAGGAPRGDIVTWPAVGRQGGSSW